MLVDIYWIGGIKWGRLGIMPRPRGGDWLEDEIKSLKFSGVEVIVSLLENEEISELEIAAEKSLCELNEISFLAFPIKDRDVPKSKSETFDFAEKLTSMLKAGKRYSDTLSPRRRQIGTNRCLCFNFEWIFFRRSF